MQTCSKPHGRCLITEVCLQFVQFERTEQLLGKMRQFPLDPVEEAQERAPVGRRTLSHHGRSESTAESRSLKKKKRKKS